MALNLPPVPQSLKPIQHYLKTASEHEGRDPVVVYWCRLYALQTALKIDKKSDEARTLLVALMDWLEKQKKLMSENEAITNDIAAQAHIENYALKLFDWADSQDRAAVFNKNVIKAFYTAWILMDVLSTYGEHSEEIARSSKYAKWKAAYINNCLKNGETPVPGPMDSDKDIFEKENNENITNIPEEQGAYSNIGFQPPSNFEQNIIPRTQSAQTKPEAANVVPVQPTKPSVTPNNAYYSSEDTSSVSPIIKLDPELIAKAQKYCKFASSALNYDDVKEAINNLEKGLNLLRTGHDY